MWEHMKGVTSMCRRQPETQPSWAFCPSHARFRWQIRHTDREPQGSVSPVRGTLLPLHFPLFLYMQIHTNDSQSLIAFRSRQPDRETIGLFPFSHVMYFVFSWRAISLSHHSITYAAKPPLWVILSWQGCPSQGQMRGNGWGWRCGWQCEHKQDRLYLPTAASKSSRGTRRKQLGPN